MGGQPPLSKVTRQLAALKIGDSVCLDRRHRSSIGTRARRLGITVATQTVVMGTNRGKLQVWRTG